MKIFGLNITPPPAPNPPAQMRASQVPAHSILHRSRLNRRTKREREIVPRIFAPSLHHSTTPILQYPIVWTDVLQAYGTTAVADKCIAVFGALSFWWLGEHGSPRVDRSDHVFFENDQFAVRFIEEIDFDYCAIDATAALITGAAS